MKTASPALFITVEGGDGVGKTSLIDAIAQRLNAAGIAAIATREPAGTEVGMRIREEVLRADGYIDPQAEALLFAADRAQHVTTIVRPALRDGVTVVQKRYIDSSVAYSDAALVLSPREVADINLWASGGLQPDITLLLDLGVDEALRRAGESELDVERREFRARLRTAFLDIARRHSGRVHVLDASAPETVVAELAMDAIANAGVRR